ncbi:GbsR/MarR family transcriptional regulator [Paenibacillus cremeus]|uniref:MarR family transcriptional regulator n=1 Tax=Paenibacillus cremeus TaxID=2163881 RepID=A0A559KBN4_9BACL|nr:hypothetical protein [Paenibacillus cremeus]TVY09545.1 hypothetical protein FPZ49_12445 [Paenibacillus cremeus]
MKERQPTFSDLKQNVSNHMSLTFDTDGFSPLVGRIFALLLFAPGPRSLQEMADELGVTKAAISVQVRTLEKFAMCQKLPTSNDRKDYYYISDDFSLTAMRSGLNKIQAIQRQVQATLDAFHALPAVSEEEKASHDAAKRRYLEMGEMYKLYMSRLEGIEEEWEKRRKLLD